MTLRRVLAVCLLNASLVAVPTPQQNKKPVTNSDVLKMVQAGLPESTIILSLENSETDLDTSPQTLIELKGHGVSQKVMDAMISAANKHRNAGSGAVAPVASNAPVNPGAGNATTPEGGAMMAKVLESLGGKAAIASVHGTRAVSTRQAKVGPSNVSMEVDITTLFPDRMYMVTKSPQFSSTTIYTNGRGSINLNGKAQDLPPGAGEEVDKAIKFSVLYVAQHADDPAYVFTVKGSEKIGEAETTVLEVANGGYQTRWNVDPATGELKRVSRMSNAGGKTVPVTFEYADWRTVSGVKVPFKVMQTGAVSATDEIKSYEINPAFDESKFGNAGAAAVNAGAVAAPPEPAKLPTSDTRDGETFPAGGKWSFEVSRDKLTGAAYGILQLKGDEPISDGIASDYPRFVIMCGGGASPKWVNSKLISPVVLGVGDTHSSFSGTSQQFVVLRSDDKFHTHAWNMADDFHVFFVDKGATKEFMNSTNARIQFRDASGHTQVATFSPAGLDKTKAAIACGEIMK